MHPSRWRRNLPVAFMIASLLAAGGSLAYSVAAATTALNKINGERARNTLLSCEKDNQQNRVLVGFIVQSIPKAKRRDPRVVAYVARARRTWPQQDCEKVVQRSVKT